MKKLYIVFRVGDVEYVLPTHEVVQLESFTGATPVPGAAHFVAGVIKVRGRVIPAIDLRARFGLDPSPRTLDTRVVISELEGRAVALVVDASREVLAITEAQLEPPPEVVMRQQNGFVSAIAHIGNRALMRLNLANVLEEGHAHGE
jgi:purine-binding chemotaxis protein CheW